MPFIHRQSCLSFIRIYGETHPHTNTGNAGLVIFPVTGSMVIDCYNYVPPRDCDGKPILKSSPDNLSKEILDTHYLSHVIDKPIIVDGRGVYRLCRQLNKPTPVALVFKLDLNINWDDIKLAL